MIMMSAVGFVGYKEIVREMESFYVAFHFPIFMMVVVK